jgi:hypothetical protein
MEIAASRIRWSSLVIASAGVWVLGFVLIGGVIFAYAFRLGFIARGQPDPYAIQQFANTAGPVWGPLLGIVLTALAAIWLGRRTAPEQIRHGVLLGAIVGGVPLVATLNVSAQSIAVFAATLLAGATGGWLASLRAARG